MVLWVKYPTAVAPVAVEMRGRSAAWRSGLKDPALLQLRHRSQLWLRFNPWPGNVHTLWVQTFKKQKKSLKKYSASPCLILHSPEED